MAAGTEGLPFATLFFDLDGTLTEPSEGIFKCIEHAFLGLGRSAPSREALREWVGPSLRRSFARALADAGEVERAIALYRERYATVGIFEARLHEGMRQLVHELSRRGARLWLATAKPEPYALRVLAHFGIAGCFEGVSATTLDGRIDSKEQVLALAVARLRELPGPALAAGAAMIGDRAEDIHAARKLGLTAIAVGHGFGSAVELEAALPDCLVSGVVELGSLLLGAGAGPGRGYASSS